MTISADLDGAPPKTPAFNFFQQAVTPFQFTTLLDGMSPPMSWPPPPVNNVPGASNGLPNIVDSFPDGLDGMFEGLPLPPNLPVADPALAAA